MLRICLAIFLVCASAHAMAQNSRTSSTANNASACQETEVAAREVARQAAPAHPKVATARARYIKPVATPGVVGGSGGDDGLPRQRGAKWQSFLPGMFR